MPECREHDHSANQEILSFCKAQRFIIAWLTVVNMVMNTLVHKILGITWPVEEILASGRDCALRNQIVWN